MAYAARAGGRRMQPPLKNVNGNKLRTCVSYLDRELDGLLFAATRSLSCEMDHHIFCGIGRVHGLNLFNGYSWNGD